MDRQTAKERIMTNRRAKAMATATVLGLGALGGVALGSNPGVPAATQQVAGGAGGATAAVVTSASGATTAVPTTQTVANVSGAPKRAPIVTRASGAVTAQDD
jgi:hypothetical protein